MFDLNAIVSAALNAAVQQAVAPLVDRITALESAVDKANLAKFIEEELIASLAVTDIVGEDRVAQIESRVAALENNPAQGVDTQAAPAADITRHIIDALGNTDHPLFKRLSSFMDAVAEQAMDDHTSTYDHDDYDSHVSDDDKHFDGDIEDAVRDALSNMSFDISIR